jgi:hypothetical protein
MRPFGRGPATTVPSVGDGRERLPVSLPGMNSAQAAGPVHRMQSNVATGCHQRQPGHIRQDTLIAALADQGLHHAVLSGRGQFHAELRRVIQNARDAADPFL